jgi:transposase
MGVAIGVDSHKSSLAVGIVDEMSRTVGVREFTNDGAGHDSLIDWVDDPGPERVIGIEGSGSYGAALARRLLQAGDDVREVPAFMSHRERKKNPSRGKSDVNDAIAIAQVVARGEGLSSPQREVIYEDLKLLSDHRDQLVRARTQVINRAHKDVVVSHPGYEKRVPKLKSKKNLKAALALLRGDQSVRVDPRPHCRDQTARRQDHRHREADRGQGDGDRDHVDSTTRDQIHRRSQDPR